MTIFVLNSGSSSFKYQLYKDDVVLAKGLVERIGQEEGLCELNLRKKKYKVVKPFANHEVAIKTVLGLLQEKRVIENLDEIDVVGHRVVQGGEQFKSSVIVGEKELQSIEDLNALAPLHNPANTLGIKIFKTLLPNTPNVATFDTAFHQTMPKKAYMYGLPVADYEELRVRKYGMHGISHYFVSNRAEQLLQKEESKIIVCHIGNGVSISAVKNGQCVDTSMGLTPLQGIFMGTRCGDLDPAAVTFVMEKRGFTASQMNDYMNKKSGVLGIFGKSDMRDVEISARAGDKKAQLVLDMLAYRIRGYIGNYVVQLGGIDAICFTAGIGENSHTIRAKICEGLEVFGVCLDENKNSGLQGKEADISQVNSTVRIFVIPTDEELVIANDCKKLVQ